MQIHRERTDMADPRAAFTPAEVVDEALIEALADVGVAERALEQRGGATVLRGMLAEARRSLECVRLCLGVDAPPAACEGNGHEQRRRA